MPVRPASSARPARAVGEGVRVPAAQRAMALLDLLAAQRGPMSLARLASELALPKSSVHALCITLQEHGYLQRQADGAFRLGPRVMVLAESFMSSTGPVQEFQALWPSAPPDETVVLSVLSGTEVVYIGVLNGDRPLGIAFNVGMRLPAHMAASGKAQLAFEPEDNVKHRFGTDTLPPRRMAGLMRELEATRHRGYGIDDEEIRAGVYCVAAPVFDASGKAVAGLGLCANKSAMGAEGAAQYRDAALRAARALTQRLGGAAARAPAESAPARTTARRSR